MGNKAIQATIGGEIIENKKINLLDKIFEIPAYQRLYEWEKDEIETLLDDMKKAYNEGKGQYFIGNITTSIDKNDSNKFILIDGQQRLTTLWFIGFYLASKGCDEWKEFITQDEKVRIAMSIRDNEENALKELAMKIQNDTIKPNENSEINLYTYLPSDIHQKIINAFECIEKWFNAMFGKYTNGKLEIDLKQLKCFSLFIYRRVCFVFVELAENTDLNRFFVRMNNRGKQLEKHEILKARILDKIKDDKSDEWQKYAKIWDLCSDMNKYIFRSENDRKILNPKAKNDKKDNNKDETETTEQKNDKLVHLAEIADEYTIVKDNKKVKDNGTHSGAESIIDFPTFLLHCYKLWVAKKCSDKIEKITIAKDKLLEIMWDAKEDKNKHDYLFAKRDKQDCKDFIIDMLRYRVFFDYFVIKNTLSDDGFAIMRLDSNNQPKKKIFENLAMIQNYLRVARQGNRQNYHHWLTPFLKYLSEDNDNKSIKECLDLKLWKPKEICEKFINLFEKLPEVQQSKFVSFLEDLDSKLAIAQSSGTSENSNLLIDIANEAIQKAQNLEFSKVVENIKWDFLNNGTGTPHYWFYRLEYYLWKNAKKIETDLNIADNNFSKIASKFYFRNLNSVEHIQPQSRAEDEKKNWHIHKDNEGKIIKRDIDCFGNLALLSVGFNSSLSNQDNADKRLDLQKKINKSDVESLKLWLVYANYPKDEDWTCKNAKKHLVQMLKVLKESLGLNSK